MVAVGIDIGTSYCRIGACINSHQFIPIPNDDGQFHTPSYVAFGAYELLVGEGAKEQAGTNATNTFYNIKRLLSYTFGDNDELDGHIRHLPFKIANLDGKVVIETDGANSQHLSQVLPKDLMVMILAKLKKDAERHLRTSVTDAVISIPTSFTYADRQVLSLAAAEVGINVLRLMNEAVLAVIPSYMQHSWMDGEKGVLVFDIGGGTVSVSLVVVEDGIFEVKATCGDDSFGGEDIDDCLVIHCTEIFRRNFGIDLTGQRRPLRRLRTACERAKRLLMTENETYLEIVNLYDDRDLRTWITRAQLEEMCYPLTSSIIGLVEGVLRDTRRSKEGIHDLLLVGGSSKIPFIQQQISQFFDGKEITTSIQDVDPELATAYGAAIQASILTGSVDEVTRQLLVMDCTHKHISIEVMGGASHVMIRRYHTIPIKFTESVTTVHDNQQGMAIRLLEGDRARSRNNFEIGTYNIYNIPPGAAGVPEVKVTIDIDGAYKIKMFAENSISGPLPVEQVAPHTPLPQGWEIKPMLVPELRAGYVNSQPAPPTPQPAESQTDQPVPSTPQFGGSQTNRPGPPTPQPGGSQTHRPVPLAPMPGGSQTNWPGPSTPQPGESQTRPVPLSPMTGGSQTNRPGPPTPQPGGSQTHRPVPLAPMPGGSQTNRPEPSMPLPGASQSNRPVPPVPQQPMNDDEYPPSYDAQVLRSLDSYQALMTDIEKMTSDEHLAHLLTVRDKNRFDRSLAEIKEWLRISKERLDKPWS